GVKVLQDDLRAEDGSEPREGDTVVIRSHGISRELFEKISGRGLRIVDATCPFVRKIHSIVSEKSREGCPVIIIGDPSHPEVKGIRGWGGDDCFVVMNREDTERIPFPPGSKVCIVSQTTFNYRKFQELVEIIARLSYDSNVINTICSATSERQTEALELATASDVMLVIGGKHSSNTQKLYDICRSRCGNTWFVSDPDDLREVEFQPGDRIGITAGASTPNTIIQEVSQHVRRAEL
ncbi:MAG: 4-hydroxy-3-methylbut-2-enyl diphosphate reductase, partial [Lachnospiraceae bacterium]|nr:4-hydroxy-3-methylbut-2-enyl diphosphate reductase [Lachnospiraceae bacterium]